MKGKCQATPNISEERKKKYNHIVENYYATFNDENRVLKNYCPFKPDDTLLKQNHLWILENGHVMISRGHTEIEEPLESLFDEIDESHQTLHDAEDIVFDVAKSSLNAIRVQKSYFGVRKGGNPSLDINVNVDTHITNAQIQTLRNCIKDAKADNVYFEVDYPMNEIEDLERHELSYTDWNYQKSKGSQISRLSEGIQLLKSIQKENLRYC